MSPLELRRVGARFVPVVCLTVLLACVPIALAAAAATPGVTSSTIRVGSSGPLSGEAAAAGGVLAGAGAYFQYVNARGGVNGRKIQFRYLDDANDPARTLENVRELVQQDAVLALFSVVGTSPNLAIRDFTNAAKVPVVFSAAGATTFGRDHAKHPYTIGYLPPYAEEGKIYARHVLASSPKRARIGVLYQADAYGKDLLAGLRKGLGAQGRKLLVDAAGYDSTASDVGAQVAHLRAGGANTLMVFASGKFASQAFAYANKLGWRPQVYLNDVAAATAAMERLPQAAARNTISIAFGKDPASPRWSNDPGAALAGRIIEKYVPGASPRNGFLVAGLASAYSFVDALERAGKNPTRDGLMQAVTSMNEASNPFLIPGIKVETTPTFRFPISQVALRRWQNGRWVLFGGLQSARP